MLRINNFFFLKEKNKKLKQKFQAIYGINETIQTWYVPQLKKHWKILNPMDDDKIYMILITESRLSFRLLQKRYRCILPFCRIISN